MAQLFSNCFRRILRGLKLAGKHTYSMLCFRIICTRAWQKLSPRKKCCFYSIKSSYVSTKRHQVHVWLITPYFSQQLSGIAVLGVGIWVRVDKNVVNMQNLIEFNSDDKSLSTAAYVLIGFGSFVLLVSAFGFLAACCANKTKFFIIGVSISRFHVVM